MINKDTIDHIAKLARLEVSESQAKEYSEQIGKVLKYFEQVSAVDTKGIEPLITPTEIETYWREDVVVQELTAEEITSNAPDKVGNLFKVPPVV
jgi:aspartyl-tRNA(Asn)/glutamyl-tRNA(Gln) amidotransferase subunit C